ncbi:MAG: NAD-dependent epimerase/dehydratase family protein [Planctomycetota bacterium]|jgi:nucleoside-diphosphate-sugar epimerase
MHLVTGASGFIGSHLVDRLLARGEQVAGCVRPTSDRRWLDGKPVALRTVDLATGEGVADAVKDATALYHVAGITGAASAEAFRKGNCEASLNLARTVLERAPRLRRFVYVSSLASTGPARASRPVTESDALQPVSSYGESKRDAEAGLRAMENLPLVIVRPPIVYGPRDRNLLSLFRLASRRLLPVVGQGRQRLSFIFGPDLAEGIAAAGEATVERGETFFLTGAAADWREAGKALDRALRVSSLRLCLPEILLRVAGEVFEWKHRLTGAPSPFNRRKVREMLEPQWTCSGAKAARALRFEAPTGLEEGFRLTAEWYRAQGWL